MSLAEAGQRVPQETLPPERLRSGSLGYPGAQVDHLDVEDLRDVALLSDGH